MRRTKCINQFKFKLHLTYDFKKAKCELFKIKKNLKRLEHGSYFMLHCCRFYKWHNIQGNRISISRMINMPGLSSQFWLMFSSSLRINRLSSCHDSTGIFHRSQPFLYTPCKSSPQFQPTSLV